MNVTKVLVIEDSKEIVETINLAFRIRWPEASLLSAGLGELGVELAGKENPDIVILDLGLPDMSGFDVLKRIRTFSRVPILILTVRFEEQNVVRGLEEGADDYMTKPFKQLELLARVKALVRRNSPQTTDTLVLGQLKFDPATLSLLNDGQPISVTRTEGLILGHLMRNAGNIMTHASLAEAVWGVNYPDADNSLKVHIRRLREKLEKDPAKPEFILTKPNVGYFMPKPA
jgi:two-component system, OmpR family, response regulator VicR